MFWKSKKNKAGTEAVSPAQEIELARVAIRQGDNRHAIRHLAAALAVEPDNTIARALLHQLMAQTKNPLELVELGKPPVPYQLVGVQAYIHNRQGELDSAVSLLTQIYEAVPGLPFLAWLVEWFSASPQPLPLKTGTAITLLNNLQQKIDGNLSSADHAQLEKLILPLATYQKSQPTETMLALLLSIFERKLGKLEDALALAQATYQKAPDYFTATVLANAYRDLGQIQEAVATYREALAFKLDDIPIRLDIGDTLCSNGQVTEGLAAYQEVLERDPRHAWAYPSYLYYQSLLNPEGDWQDQLKKFAKANPTNERAAKLVKELSPYLTELLSPGDASVNLARRVIEETTFPAKLSVGLSSMEAPSAYRVLELIQLELYGKADLDFGVAEIQQPDPRKPRGEVGFVLWQYNGTLPKPNLPPPSQAVADVVAELAKLPYEAAYWWRLAEKAAKKLGTNQLNELLAVMLYPPPRPQNIAMWDWLQRVQFASTFIIARLESGWENSVRRWALMSLARGPMDWTVTAAIVALCLIVVKEQVGKAEVEALYLELLQNLPKPGGVPYQHALVFCSFYLEPSPELARVARKALDRL